MIKNTVEDFDVEIIKYKAELTYNVYRRDGKPIAPEHVDPLTEHARNHVFDMAKEGYWCGQFWVTLPLNEDSGVEIDYEGWFMFDYI